MNVGVIALQVAGVYAVWGIRALYDARKAKQSRKRSLDLYASEAANFKSLVGDFLNIERRRAVFETPDEEMAKTAERQYLARGMDVRIYPPIGLRDEHGRINPNWLLIAKTDD